MKTSGNTILVTGGGSGIGRALAEALHAAGNTVIIAGRRLAILEAVAAANPGMAVIAVDMGDAAAIGAFAATVVASHPRLNVLVNNAGIMVAENLRSDIMDLADAEAMVTTNLLGPIRLTAALLPHLRQQAEAQGEAAILNVTSGLAFVPLVATPTYNATKAALHSYSESLRSQLQGTGVGVIEVIPPAVATDLMPGHAANPNSMPLAAYITETMALLADPAATEIRVERVKVLRNAEADGQYAKVFAMLNAAH